MDKKDIFEGIEDPKLFWWSLYNMLKRLKKEKEGLKYSLGLPNDSIHYHDHLEKVLRLEQQIDAIAYVCDTSRAKLIEWVGKKLAAVQAYEKEEHKEKAK